MFLYNNPIIAFRIIPFIWFDFYLGIIEICSKARRRISTLDTKDFADYN